MSTSNEMRCPALLCLSLSLTLLLFLVATAVNASAAEKSCLDCHKKLISKSVVHPAITQFVRMEQGCPSCHQAPHGKKKAEKSLTEKVPELCFQCHDKDLFTKTNVHAPVAAGDCTSCHNPHASDNSALLIQPLPYLCQTCHDDKQDGRHILGGYGLGGNHPIRGRKDPSRIRRELSCTGCHSPHSSSYGHLFANSPSNPDNLCLKCHSRITVRP